MRLELTKDEFLILDYVVYFHKRICEDLPTATPLCPVYTQKEFVENIEKIYEKLTKMRETQVMPETQPMPEWKQRMLKTFLGRG